MKILFLLTQDLESPAGVGRYFPWARALAQRGHTVSMAALHPDFETLNQTDFVRDGVEVHYVAQMHVRKQGSRKTYFPAHRLLGVAARATQALTHAVLSIPADVIQVGKPHPMNSLAGLWGRARRGAALFVDCDDFELANLHFSGQWQKWGVRFFERGMPRWADHVSTHNTFLRNYILGLGVPEQRITYIPNGVDEVRFAASDPGEVVRLRQRLALGDKKVIAFIGTLSLTNHPVDLLLQAFQRVHALHSQVMLLLVGGGEAYDRLVLQVQEMGLGGATIFRGRIPGAEIPAYYRLADVVVDPVLDDDVARSRLPLKMFESWACGVPFVTGDVGDRRLLMGSPPAGLLARPGDAESLAEALMQVLYDDRLSAVLRARGLERAQEYSWNQLVERMETAYLQVVERRRDRRT